MLVPRHSLVRCKQCRTSPSDTEGKALHDPPQRGLGLVWIDCSYPVLATGLKEALDVRARVLVGQAAPTEAEVPCCAVFDTSGAKSISEGIERIRGVNPDITIPVFSLRVDLPLARAALRHGVRVSSTPVCSWIR